MGVIVLGRAQRVLGLWFGFVFIECGFLFMVGVMKWRVGRAKIGAPKEVRWVTGGEWGWVDEAARKLDGSKLHRCWTAAISQLLSQGDKNP